MGDVVDAPTVVPEDVHVPERLVVAPVAGVFRPAPPAEFTCEGEIVRRGQVVGTVTSSGLAVDVPSAFTGLFMGLLAFDGERVRPGQPLAWLRSTPP